MTNFEKIIKDNQTPEAFAFWLWKRSARNDMCNLCINYMGTYAYCKTHSCLQGITDYMNAEVNCEFERYNREVK